MTGSNTMWMVRAGEGAFLIEEFRKKNIIAIGWGEMGDLSGVKAGDEIKTLVKETYLDSKKAQVSISAGQIRRFLFDFQQGDKVVSYDPDKRSYLVGEILSGYKFAPSVCEYPNIRNVKWLGEVDRDKLSTSTKNTLGAISTIFNLGDDAEKEITDLLEGKAPPSPELGEDDEEGFDLLKEDMLSKAHEFIKDKLLSLDWEDMQELVAGLLRAMGYKTIVSAKGADRGKDIQASPDGLGLEEPRIKVEVKHRSGQMGSQEIRSFTGGLRPGDKGLYVSTGGFSKDAKYEADRSNIPVTLIDSDLLVQLVTQYYDTFDSEARTLLPLTKIYWPT
jgi:restriction system protein